MLYIYHHTHEKVRGLFAEVSFCHMGSEDQTHFVSLDCKYPYLLNHLISTENQDVSQILDAAGCRASSTVFRVDQYFDFMIIISAKNIYSNVKYKISELCLDIFQKLLKILF